MLYGGYDADPSPPTLPSGRKAFHGASHICAEPQTVCVRSPRETDLALSRRRRAQSFAPFAFPLTPPASIHPSVHPSSAGNQRTALPFATYDENENVHGNQYRSPRLHKKNSKFDVGAAKVGAGNHDAVSQQYEYERMQAQAAAMKARNQYGDGNIFGQ